MNNTTKQLTNLRKKLDHIDADIISLLEQRQDISDHIGAEKNKLKMPLTDQTRESDIITALSKLSRNPILKNGIPSIFQPIFTLSKVKRILSVENSIAFSQIGVIGTGLIGGSIAKALKMRNSGIKITALNHHSQITDKTAVDKIIQSINQLVIGCDLIILASPIHTIIPLAKQIHRLSHKLTSQLTIIDCASVKSEITQEFSYLTNNQVEFIPTHPMAGSEKRGYENSDGLLFVNRPWIITPHDRNTERSVNDIYQFVRFLGSDPIEMTAEEHDRKIALVSHLAFLISVLYFSYVLKQDKTSLKLAGPGFHSITRLAKGNADMHEQIFATNNENIVKQSKEFIKYFSTILSEKTDVKSLFRPIEKQAEKLFK